MYQQKLFTDDQVENAASNKKNITPVTLIEMYRLLRQVKDKKAFVYNYYSHSLAYNVSDIHYGTVSGMNFEEDKGGKTKGMELLFTTSKGLYPLQVEEFKKILSLHIESLNGDTLLHYKGTLLLGIKIDRGSIKSTEFNRTFGYMSGVGLLPAISFRL